MSFKIILTSDPNSQAPLQSVQRARGGALHRMLKFAAEEFKVPPQTSAIITNGQWYAILGLTPYGNSLGS
ncbi:unnamed protein product [Urochloa humidicola]